MNLGKVSYDTDVNWSITCKCAFWFSWHFFRLNFHCHSGHIVVCSTEGRKRHDPRCSCKGNAFQFKWKIVNHFFFTLLSPFFFISSIKPLTWILLRLTYIRSSLVLINSRYHYGNSVCYVINTRCRYVNSRYYNANSRCNDDNSRCCFDNSSSKWSVYKYIDLV